MIKFINVEICNNISKVAPYVFLVRATPSYHNLWCRKMRFDDINNIILRQVKVFLKKVKVFFVLLLHCMLFYIYTRLFY